MEKKDKPNTGRPSSFTQDIADSICEQLMTSSKSLRTICQQEGMPTPKTILNWLTEGSKPDGQEWAQTFLRQYARAKEEQADYLAEEILEIADDSKDDVLRSKEVKNADGTKMVLLEENKEFTNRSRLRVDARKWIASKLKPKKYGDKLDLTSLGDKLNHGPMQVEIVKPDEE